MDIKTSISADEVESSSLKMLEDIIEEFEASGEISPAIFGWSSSKLNTITSLLATKLAQKTVHSLSQPTSSALVKERKKLSQAFWDYLTTHADVDESVKKPVFYEFSQSFDRATFKMLTGHELPKTKDGFKHNALQGLRLAAHSQSVAVNHRGIAHE